MAALVSSQPNSVLPRMRAPAATVSEPALISPTTTPDASRLTWVAASILPSSSPAMVTLSARTLPVSFAPDSMVRSPCTLTSPLNLPAMRTLPLPSILPSIMMSAAIRDSVRARSDCARAAGDGAGAVSTRDERSIRLWSGASGAGAGACRLALLSFQMAMEWVLSSGTSEAISFRGAHHMEMQKREPNRKTTRRSCTGLILLNGACGGNLGQGPGKRGGHGTDRRHRRVQAGGREQAG